MGRSEVVHVAMFRNSEGQSCYADIDSDGDILAMYRDVEDEEEGEFVMIWTDECARIARQMANEYLAQRREDDACARGEIEAAERGEREAYSRDW